MAKKDEEEFDEEEKDLEKVDKEIAAEDNGEKGKEDGSGE